MCDLGNTTTRFKNIHLSGGVIKSGGTSSQFLRADGTVDRIIRGDISSAGAIQQGSGFSMGTITTGRYPINFTPAFSSVPTVVVSINATEGDYGFIGTASLTASGFIVMTRYSSSILSNTTPFNFIVIGPN